MLSCMKTSSSPLTVKSHDGHFAAFAILRSSMPAPEACKKLSCPQVSTHVHAPDNESMLGSDESFETKRSASTSMSAFSVMIVMKTSPVFWALFFKVYACL